MLAGSEERTRTYELSPKSTVGAVTSVTRECARQKRSATGNLNCNHCLSGNLLGAGKCFCRWNEQGDTHRATLNLRKPA